MSSSSIARQNRRNRLRQLPPDPSGLAASSQSGNDADLSESLSAKSDRSKKRSPDADGKGSFSASTGCSFIKCDVSSRPFDKIFVEDERGFKAIDPTQLFQTLQDLQIQASSSKSDLAIDIAHKSAIYFHNFSFLCHGLLGGMSFIETLLLVHLMMTSSNEEDALKFFGFLAQPIHNVFNFLCIICCISAFDRYDIGNLKEFFKYVKKCKLKVIVLLIYPICLLLSFSTANVDEKLYLPERNLTLFETFQLENAGNELFYWKTLSLSKCAGSFLAWIIVSFEPNQNLFLRHLKNIIQRTQINMH